MTDPEVIRIRFSERNPDLAMPIIIQAPNTRNPIRGTTTQRIGPFTPTSHTSGGGSAIKMGNVSVGGSAIKLGSASVGGSAIKLGSESVGGSTKGQGSAPRAQPTTFQLRKTKEMLTDRLRHQLKMKSSNSTFQE